MSLNVFRVKHVEDPRQARCGAWQLRALCAPAGVFLLLAGVGKLVEPNVVPAILIRAGVPPDAAAGAAWFVPGLELATGACFLLGWHSKYLLTTGLILYGAFTAALVAMWIRTGTGSCNCFGSLLSVWDFGSLQGAILRNIVCLGLLITAAFLQARVCNSALSSSFR